MQIHQISIYLSLFMFVSGIFETSFYYVPSSTATFAEFLVCMNHVHEFSLQHANWSPGGQPGDPFLPVPPGCPSLVHDGPNLDDEGQQWECIWAMYDGIKPDRILQDWWLQSDKWITVC